MRLLEMSLLLRCRLLLEVLEGLQGLLLLELLEVR
jgi:hypothetical protein